MTKQLLVNFQEKKASRWLSCGWEKRTVGVAYDRRHLTSGQVVVVDLAERGIW